MSTNEMPTPTLVRRFKFNQCPVCAKVIHTHKLGEHMKHEHHQSISISQRDIADKILYICINKTYHPDYPAYLRLDGASDPQKKNFIEAHKNHVSGRHPLNKDDRDRMAEVFKEAFNPSVIIPINPPPNVMVPLNPPPNAIESPNPPPAIIVPTNSPPNVMEAINPPPAIIGPTASPSSTLDSLLRSEEEAQPIMDVMEVAAHSPPQVELFRAINDTPTLQSGIERLSGGRSINDIGHQLMYTNFPYEEQAMPEFDSGELAAYLEPQIRVRAPTERHSQYIGVPRSRQVIDVGPSYQTMSMPTEPPQRQEFQSQTDYPARHEFQSQTDYPAHREFQSQTDDPSQMGEVGADYFREMYNLNNVTIHQLMDDRKQLDEHLHATRIKLLEAMTHIIDDMKDRMPERDYFQRVQEIQDRFIRKLATENVNILIPLRQLLTPAR